MKRTMRKRMARLFLCALMCIVMAVPLAGPALAFADSGGDAVSNITIRITPPSGWATQRAEVEVRITDNAGTGFQSAQVKVGGKSWKDITGELEQTENRYYCVAEITENCTIAVRVDALDGKTYEKSEYIHCFNSASDDRSAAASGQDSSGTPSESSEAAIPSASKVPSGQGTVVDNATSGDGREFFTIATQDENTFYLIIDRQSDSENVYFLDTVKESDLLSLAEKDRETGVSAVPDPEPVCICTDKCAPGEVNTDCPVCVLSLKDCTGKAPAVDPDTGPEPETQETGDSSAIVMVIIAALAVGGAGYYLKIYKPKHDLDDAEDFDDLTGGDEETVNEDALPAAMGERTPYPEPEEPDFPEGYGYEEPEGEE